ncbi:formimidoylglutamase [Psychroserpens sp. NJDZ02]|uniref:formimidoylglutamase n=1 Tax=Psychroserpens sp. NJDZ02 TaxID=2570561 RepID=UPI0010A8CC8A|nr:formimidoylglutamase [Psychroserpens sp. NJDZ02]QCE42703.1 arginase [Psychroserpens sp. NJDZ02]
MDKLVLLNNSIANKILNIRSGETKFGEHAQYITSVDHIYDTLKTLDVKYVIFGIPEDIGVFANYGKSGTSSTWDTTIKILLNTQSNDLNAAKKVLILGHLDFSKEKEELSKLKQDHPKHITKARKLVTEIDKHVVNLISTIVSAGKIPIAIGGGHNNAYGMIKGTSLALKQPVNSINFDAHTDFRTLEGRHSGNGFSYAYAEGFLKRYFVFGLHENYTSSDIFNQFKDNKHLDYNTYEAIAVRHEKKFQGELHRAEAHINKSKFGIEIDCDAILNVPSSAQTPSGFSVEKTRQFLHHFASLNNANYLHICEAVAKKKKATQTGKLITYLITDFIRSNSKTND